MKWFASRFDFTSIPIRVQFDFSSISLRIQFDPTSISLRSHFEFTSASQRELEGAGGASHPPTIIIWGLLVGSEMSYNDFLLCITGAFTKFAIFENRIFF